ncbi:hypothetical protein [Thermosporothrix hazakensis]|nr:hypothetical protein [Thermosporothrix hazakensis]
MYWTWQSRAATGKNLLKAGYALRVYNRTASKAEPLVALGAHDPLTR